MATITTVAGDAMIIPVIQLIKEVINKEDTRQILQSDLRGMESLLQDIAFFFGYIEQKEPLEMVKIWLQLLQNSLTEANGLLDRREGSCQSCLDSVMCNPRTLFKEIREWKAFFNHLYQGFQNDFFELIVLSGNVINSRVVAPVTELLKDVMNKEQDNPQIPQTEPPMKTLLQHMETLLQETTTLFRDEPDIVTLFRCQKNELLNITRTHFQLLQRSLTEAKGLFDFDPPKLSQQIGKWSRSFDQICRGFQENLLQRIDLSGNAINSRMVGPVMKLLKDVINKEDNHQILETDLTQMESLLQDITILFRDEPDITTLFQRQKKELLEIMKTCFQSLRSCLIEAKGLFDLEPRTLSQERREWKASFNHVYQSFQNDLLQHIALSGNAINSRMVSPAMELLKDVINKEDNLKILQTDLRQMESLLQDITNLFRDEPDISITFQGQKIELLQIMRNCFRLLQSSLRDAKALFDLHPRPLSQEIGDWKASFNNVYEGFQNDLFQRIIGVSGNVINSRVVAPVAELLKDVMDKADNRQILQAELRQMESLLQDITTLFRDEPDSATLFQRPSKELLEFVKTRFQLLQSSLTKAKDLFDLHSRGLSEEIREWSASLDKMYHGLQSDLSRMVTSVQFVSSKPFCAYKEDAYALLQGVAAPASLRREAQPLSKDEAWTLFRTVAFKGVQPVSMDIQEYARNTVEKCRSDLPLAIKVVAAAMIGKTSVHEWDNCLFSIQKVDPSFHHLGRLDAQLYAQLRYSYDALPNSHVKRCFLYCAMYKKGEEIDTDTLLQMWIGEGLVNSQQASYLMDMAIGRKYLKLLVDRFFFQRVSQSRDVFEGSRTISVHNFIHDMAVYIAQKEENCVFVASQNQLNFPEVDSENCSRISVAENFKMEDLPTGFRCPKLASLTLQGNPHLKELPSELLLSVTCLRVLNLSGCSQITSVPTSIGQLRMLEFLSLSGLPRIKDFPKHICNLSSLQFLDLSSCTALTSLPSQIGQLRNLKHLNLEECQSLKMIPREMCELTSLSRLQLSDNTSLSVEVEAQANIWSLKGLKSLTELQITIDTLQQHGEKSRIKDGIMGTWSEMRHLALNYNVSFLDRGSSYSYEEDLLPEDMQNMKKLQSFMLERYVGLSLPNCMFEHLEMVKLIDCDGISELSPLERLPNLKLLKLELCFGLRELGIGSPSGYVSLQKVVLKGLGNLERLGGGASERGVWDERTLPQLRVLKIVHCESLKRFPKGMENLPNLCALIYQPWSPHNKSAKEWWESLMWEDDNMKVKLGRIFIPREPVRKW